MKELDWESELTSERMLKIEVAVQKGIALLDEKHPGWHRRIDLIELDMRSGAQCVLGQSFATTDGHAGYMRGLRLLELQEPEDEYRYGFNVKEDFEDPNDDYLEWDYLELLWKEEVEERLADEAEEGV